MQGHVVDERASERVVAAMVVVGDELLDGSVTDVNSQVFAAAMAAQGVTLERVHTVSDQPGEIVAALHRELGAPTPRLVVTSGGIGSTPDDLTFAAVASALDVQLERNAVIEARIVEALDGHRAMGIPVTDGMVESMLRMADVPQGARLLDVAGWVPAIVVDRGGGVERSGLTVAVLPGVPRSFSHIVDEGLVPLVAGRNPVPTVVELHHGLPESLLNPAFERIDRELPQVKLGSYPGQPMRVRLAGTASDVERAAAVVTDHLRALLVHEGAREVGRAWGGLDRVERVAS